MKIYGDRISGNCLKVKWTANYLHRTYEWIDVDVVAGGARVDTFLSINPAGQVPCVEFDDGRMLAQSNAIVTHLAEGSDLMPDDPFTRAKAFEWMFWEQYSHEPYIAVRRFQKLYLGKSDEDIPPHLLERGNGALSLMEQTLSDKPFFVGGTVSIADIALLPYTAFAADGGFDLSVYPNISDWVGRAKAALKIDA